MPNSKIAAQQSSLARVAHLLDEYRVVINRGAAQGVAMGDEYVIFGYGEEILDPESRQSLGRLEMIRGIGKVTQLQDAISVLSTTAYREETLPDYNLLLGRQNVQRTRKVPVPFRSPEIGDFARINA